MTNPSVRYDLDDDVALITIDDGKRNALPPEVFRGIYSALDRAEKDNAIVILTGREEVFSAGFDLKVLRSGSQDTLRMLKMGYSLTARIMEYPYPVIAACNGHVLAMGVFMMLSCDTIIGTRGDFRISANEVELGLTMPRVAATMLKHRLTPADYQRAVVLSQYFSPDDALLAGFFDELVDPGELLDRAREIAADLKRLNMAAHRDSKRRIRADTIKAVRRQVPLDLVDAVRLGLRAVRQKKG